ncbi:MAG: hypothetical protein TEF_03925 [Rhizobiales bacterium NRL2]|nr:MAG: hypothetical protein TEF_03925 [Rhizobiales bacterium NRL2]
MYFGFEAQKHFRNTVEKSEVHSLLAKRANLGTGKEVVSITESDFPGRYFFQVAEPGDDGVTVAYGWIEPEACKRATEASCIEVMSGKQVLRPVPSVDSLPTAGDPAGIATAATETSETTAGDTTTPEASPDNTTEIAPASATRAAETSEPERSESPRYRVTASKVNVRAGPGTAYEVVDVMTPEATFVILESSDDWSRVTADGGENPVAGWIWSELITGVE